MVTSFSVQGFRNLQRLSLTITSPLVIFHGSNGQGKTNILEAISIAACGSSFHGEDKEFWLPFNAELHQFAQLSLCLDNGVLHKVVIARDGKNKMQMKCWQNDVPVSRQALIGTIPVVVFEPQDMNMFYAESAQRRAFLDNVLVQVSFPYRQAYVQAKRILANRNRLLKAIMKGEAESSELIFWNQQYTQVGAVIQREREHLIAFLKVQLPLLYHDFSAKKLNFNLHYDISAFDPEKYSIPEKFRGFTLSGQHRDDIEVFVDGRPWVNLASRGEMRTLILALKGAILNYLSLQSDQSPLFLLDDILSELDVERRELILQWQNKYQIFLSSATDIPSLSHPQQFTVEAGNVQIG